MPVRLDPNLKLSPADPRDYIAKLDVVPLPPSVDLKPLVLEVENQLNYNSCTANAGCSALELMFNLNGFKVDLSRMYLYYYTRKLSGIDGDAGAYPKDIGAALLHNGTCYESTWGYSEDNLITEPNVDAIAEAENFKILSYAQIADDVLTQIKLSVAQNIPVLLTMYVHKGFFNLSGDWRTHKWNFKSSLFNPNPAQGLHEVLVIGYDDVAQRLLVENSWGSGWGDGGFFGLPYEALVPDVVPELWVVTPNPASLTYLKDNPPPPVVVDPIVPPVAPTKDYGSLISKIVLGVMVIGLIVGVILSN